MKEKFREIFRVDLKDSEEIKTWLLNLATELKLSPTFKKQLTEHIKQNEKDLKENMNKLKQDVRSQDTSFWNKMLTGYGVSGVVIRLALAAI